MCFTRHTDLTHAHALYHPFEKNLYSSSKKKKKNISISNGKILNKYTYKHSPGLVQYPCVSSQPCKHFAIINKRNKKFSTKC